ELDVDALDGVRAANRSCLGISSERSGPPSRDAKVCGHLLAHGRDLRKHAEVFFIQNWRGEEHESMSRFLGQQARSVSRMRTLSQRQGPSVDTEALRRRAESAHEDAEGVARRVGEDVEGLLGVVRAVV